MNDLISRQAAIMDAESWIAVDEYEKHLQKNVVEWLKEFPPAEAGADTISRQAAIRWVKTECNPYGKPTLDFESGKKVIEHLEQMPSAKDALEDAYAHGYTYAESKFREMLDAQPDIIRCRNCKFASGDSRICMKFGHSPIGELDFCAWAERRTDEAD